jgi:sirohydrochlorin cobaltochelatase
MAERGVLLFAHGARDPRWAEPFQRVLGRLADQAPDLPAALAFLEFMTPDLEGGVDALAARGCRSILIVPLFLGTGGHLRDDVPALVDAARRAHPALAIRLAPAIGEQDAVTDAIARACATLART